LHVALPMIGQPIQKILVFFVSKISRDGADDQRG